MKVKNFISASSGNPVKNQFIIEDDSRTVFQSYQTVIAVKDYADGITYLDAERWDYSTTTGKYRNQFLGMNKSETEKAIKAGSIILTNLN